jgi:hypothetical protein
LPGRKGSTYTKTQTILSIVLISIDLTQDHLHASFSNTHTGATFRL